MPDTPQTPTLREHLEDITAVAYVTGTSIDVDAIIAAFEQYLTDNKLPYKMSTQAANSHDRAYNKALDTQREAYLKGLKSE